MSPGSGFKQTYPFPLALCFPKGTIRPCSKSTFRAVLSGVPGCTSLSHDLFVTTNPPSDLVMVVDFLFFGISHLLQIFVHLQRSVITSGTGLY